MGQSGGKVVVAELEKAICQLLLVVVVDQLNLGEQWCVESWILSES